MVLSRFLSTMVAAFATHEALRDSDDYIDSYQIALTIVVFYVLSPFFCVVLFALYYIILVLELFLVIRDSLCNFSYCLHYSLFESNHTSPFWPIYMVISLLDCG